MQPAALFRQRCQMSSYPPIEVTVPVDLTLSRSDEVQSGPLNLISREPALLPAQAVPAGTRSRDRWLGILGLFGVAVILVSTVYSIARYLW